MATAYQTQIEQNGKLLAIESSIPTFRNMTTDEYDQIAIYEYLRKHTSKENPAHVYTVCNKHLGGREFIEFDDVNENVQLALQPYDISDKSFWHHIPRVENGNDLSDELLWLTVQCSQGKHKDAFNGYLICDEKKTYVDLRGYKQLLNSEKTSPLALLTKKLVHPVRKDDCDIVGEPSIISSWYGKAIYFSKDKPKDYNDLTNPLLTID